MVAGEEKVFRDSREECPREGRQQDRGVCASVILPLLLPCVSPLLSLPQPPSFSL